MSCLALSLQPANGSDILLQTREWFPPARALVALSAFRQTRFAFATGKHQSVEDGDSSLGDDPLAASSGQVIVGVESKYRVVYRLVNGIYVLGITTVDRDDDSMNDVFECIGVVNQAVSVIVAACRGVDVTPEKLHKKYAEIYMAMDIVLRGVSSIRLAAMLSSMHGESIAKMVHSAIDTENKIRGGDSWVNVEYLSSERQANMEVFSNTMFELPQETLAAGDEIAATLAPAQAVTTDKEEQLQIKAEESPAEKDPFAASDVINKPDEQTKGESSGITPSLPVETAEIPAKPKPEENKPEIREGGNVVEETKSEVSEIEEGSEIKSPMVSTDIPETMTADPAKEDIQPMPFQPEEVQQEQPREADQMNKKEVIEEEIEPEKPTELHENPHPEPADEQTIKETENKDLRKEEMNTAIEEIQKEKEPDMENLEAQRKENGDDHEMTEDQELQREEIQEEQPEIEEMKGDETHEQREVEAKEEKGNVKIQESGWIKSGFRPRSVFVGSALIGFLIVLVIELMRQNTKKSRK